MNAQAEICIFDSLTHPCVDEKFSLNGRDYSFSGLQNSISTSQVKWACAVGLDGVGSYEHEAFITKVNKYPNLIGIAAYGHQKSLKDIEKDVDKIISLGFKAVKVHPKISNINVIDIENLCKVAENRALPIFLCTYCYGSPCAKNFFVDLVELLDKFPRLKILLVHGGGVELLKYAELVRNYKNLLLDLSFTMLKYQGSSLDLDIQFLFNNFDRRICIGTDYPDFNQYQLSERFQFFSKNLGEEKKRNIAFKNLGGFLNIEDFRI